MHPDAPRQATRKTRSKHDERQRQIDLGVRPLWVLLPGMRPVMVSTASRASLADALYFCREGDPAWRPIAELTREDDR